MTTRSLPKDIVENLDPYQELLLGMAHIMCAQMEEVAQNQMKSVGMIRGSLREHLPELQRLLAPFTPKEPPHVA